MERRAVSAVAGLAGLAWLAGCGLADSGSSRSELIDSETQITLERTSCFGSCPAYSLSIRGDGTVSYVGKAYVSVEGAASKQVAVSDVQALVDQMLQADYFDLSMPDECREGIYTDAPSATTSLTLGERSHTVGHYHGNPCAPAALQVLEDAIDEVAGSAQWLGCPDGGC